MCGIAGILDFRHKINHLALDQFTDALAHRGPDDKGTYIDHSGWLGLGHRRLSILDLSKNGKQPMEYLNGRFVITHNGEVYNFIELRKELETYGYRFRSQSDTEVVLAAYDKWGRDCLYKFNGMWAFAIWDTKDKTLFLSRDRFGIKPLYYLYIPEKLFAFASETIAFSRLDNFKREFDEANISRVLNDVFCLEGYGKTIFKNVHQVLPGHFLTVSKKQGLVSKKWWSTFDHLQKVPDSYEQQVEEFKNLFKSACLLRTRSDVPIATALSGGVDSSAVYCMLRNIKSDGRYYERTPQDWHKAFIATFPGTKNDEKAYASEVVRYTNGSAKYFSPEYANLTEKIISSTIKSDYIYLTPDVAYDIYARMRQEDIAVSLDGHGVDEMLFGYPSLVRNAYITVKRSGRYKYADDLFDTFINMYSPDFRDEARRALINYRRNSSFLNRIYNQCIPNSIKHLYRNLKKGKTEDRQNWLLQLPKQNSGGNNPSYFLEAGRILHKNFHQTTLPTILRNFDRASMRSGVEIRMPFLDWRLVAYVFSLPLESKVGGGYTKRILRDAMVGLMPENIRTRKLKIGLNAPMVEWFSGELSEFIIEEVHSGAFLNSNIWNGPAIRDFAETKVRNKSWNWNDCVSFWPYLNAHILMKGSSC